MVLLHILGKCMSITYVATDSANRQSSLVSLKSLFTFKKHLSTSLHFPNKTFNSKRNSRNNNSGHNGNNSGNENNTQGLMGRIVWAKKGEGCPRKWWQRGQKNGKEKQQHKTVSKNDEDVRKQITVKTNKGKRALFPERGPGGDDSTDINNQPQDMWRGKSKRCLHPPGTFSLRHRHQEAHMHIREKV